MSDEAGVRRGVLYERAGLLNRLTMVRWDRAVPGAEGTLTVYGWIARDDGRSDFVLVAFQWPDEPTACSVWTSSAAHDAAIMEAIGLRAGEQFRCERVADVFDGMLDRQVGYAP